MVHPLFTPPSLNASDHGLGPQMKSPVLALLFVVATPVFAQEDFPFSAFRNELDAGLSDTAPPLSPSPGFDGTIHLAGGLPVALDRTPLSALSDAFDVAPQTYQHVGYTTSWVCFTSAGRRVWYLADLTYETRDDAFIGTIIDEPADPATDGLFLCREEPAAMPAPHPEVPAIGSMLAELNAFHTVTMRSSTRYAGGNSAYVPPDGTPSISRTIYYRLTGDVVDALSIGGGYTEPAEE
jgi:hypothetical protein